MTDTSSEAPSATGALPVAGTIAGYPPFKPVVKGLKTAGLTVPVVSGGSTSALSSGNRVSPAVRTGAAVTVAVTYDGSVSGSGHGTVCVPKPFAL